MAQQDTSRKNESQNSQKPSAASSHGVVEFINQSFTVASADQSRLMHMQGVYV